MALLLSAIGGLLHGCQLSATKDGEALLSREMGSILRDHALPGMTVAVAGPARLTALAMGQANLETGDAMSVETTMLVASIGKTFVAGTVLQLADEGKIDLDDPIERWLGERDWFDRLPNARQITVRHLLSHRSGLPDHVHMAEFASLWPNSLETMRPEDLIALTFDSKPLSVAGEAMVYSDTGYLLLGLVIEAVAGRPYETIICDRFILPLELASTGPSNRRVLPGLARGYVSGASGLDLPPRTTDDEGVLEWDPSIEWTGGGLYSTSSDLARWGRAFLSGRLLSTPTYRAAIAPHPLVDGSLDDSYGLGVSIRNSSAFGPVYGHRGWIPGYVSSLQYYPDYGIAIAFQINTDIGIVDSDRPVILEIEERLASIILPRSPSAAAPGQPFERIPVQ